MDNRYHTLRPSQRQMWMGVPVHHFSGDLVSFQELIFDMKPKLIVEFGTRYGGGTVFFESLLHSIHRWFVYRHVSGHVRIHMRFQANCPAKNGKWRFQDEEGLCNESDRIDLFSQGLCLPSECLSARQGLKELQRAERGRLPWLCLPRGSHARSYAQSRARFMAGTIIPTHTCAGTPTGHH